VLLEPQPRAEHRAQGVADRVVLVAGHGLDFGPGRAQAGFQGVGRVQQLADARWRRPEWAADDETRAAATTAARTSKRVVVTQGPTKGAGPSLRRFPCRIKQFASPSV
jgi:hypothetical protein